MLYLPCSELSWLGDESRRKVGALRFHVYGDHLCIIMDTFYAMWRVLPHYKHLSCLTTVISYESPTIKPSQSAYIYHETSKVE